MRQCAEIKYLLWKIDLNYSTRSGRGTLGCFSPTVIRTWERGESLVKQTCRPTFGKFNHSFVVVHRLVTLRKLHALLLIHCWWDIVYYSKWDLKILFHWCGIMKCYLLSSVLKLVLLDFTQIIRIQSLKSTKWFQNIEQRNTIKNYQKGHKSELGVEIN